MHRPLVGRASCPTPEVFYYLLALVSGGAQGLASKEARATSTPTTGEAPRILRPIVGEAPVEIAPNSTITQNWRVILNY